MSTELDDLDVASPCEAPWEKMRGTERVRFCDQCGLNVYNLSQMSRKDAEDLVQRTEGRLCVRFHRRTDGTMLTKDCPVGKWQQMRRTSLRGLITASAAAFLVAATDNPIRAAVFDVEPFKSILGLRFFRSIFTPTYVTMGEVAINPPSKTRSSPNGKT